ELDEVGARNAPARVFEAARKQLGARDGEAGSCERLQDEPGSAPDLEHVVGATEMPVDGLEQQCVARAKPPAALLDCSQRIEEPALVAVALHRKVRCQQRNAVLARGHERASGAGPVGGVVASAAAQAALHCTLTTSPATINP